MNSSPLVSVIIPVYGTEKYLKKCLDSIVSQTYENLEIIIVNDGTKDKSENIIKQYISEDDRIKYVRHSKNRGLFRARVSGAEEANGDYIAFVDSDDYVSHDYYRLLVTKAIDTGAQITAANTVFEDTDGSKKIKQLYQLCFEKDILTGDEIKEKFFGQEGYCFSWHTVWNKIYSRELWDKCFDSYKAMEKHLIMTEDIAFSIPLLYNAESLAVARNANYFYCKHKEASTNSENITLSKFKKNASDIKIAFDFAENYLKMVSASDEIIYGFAKLRQKYSRMWRTLQNNSFKAVPQAYQLVNDFLPDYKKSQKNNEFCFDCVEAKFNDGIEYIKSVISYPEVKYVSFDFFDTLVFRPFYDPEDIFDILEHKFEEINGHNSNVSFRKIRKLSEAMARRNTASSMNVEDITLTEIYLTMEKHFFIGHSVAEEMKNAENELEIKCSYVRKTGKELYDYACFSGKKVIITSDMYLEMPTVNEILRKNGYGSHCAVFLSSQERSLKGTGSLFKKIIKQLKCRPNRIIHIGDTWNSDIVPAQKLGIRTFFLPKSREVFENSINGVVTNNCGSTEKYIAGPFANSKAVRRSIGYRCMLAIAANKYFDNPYSGFNDKSDFNCDPYFMGFYAVGMHMLAISKWLYDSAVNNGITDIFFLSRDGYLPKKAFELYIGERSGIKTHYIHGSRKLTLPLLINDKTDLFDLPVELNNHTHKSLCRLLQFCSKIDECDLDNFLTESGFVSDMEIVGDANLSKFIEFFADKMFDSNKLKAEQEILKKYYSCIGENAVIFDMGYSGRIQSAISAAVGRGIDGYYIHTDNSKCAQAQRKFGFKIYSFYASVPASTGIMREYLLSDPSPSCSRISYENGSIVPEFDKDTMEYPEKFIINTVHRGALDFIKEYLSRLGEYSCCMDFVPQEASYPFEYLLRFMKKEDMKIFGLCRFEDIFFGNIASVSAEKLFNNQLCDIPEYKMPSDYSPLERVDLDLMNEIDLSEDTDDSEDEDLFVMKKSKSRSFSKKSRTAMFLDVIDNDKDSEKDKMAKCAGNTSNLVFWDAIAELIAPDVIKNWYMTNEGGFDPDNYDIFLTTNLVWIQENQDITYLDKLLTKIGDKPLLPIGIGLSVPTEKSDFKLSSGSVKVLADIAERCKSVGVRGEYTAEILSGFGIKNCFLIGCPSVYSVRNKISVKGGAKAGIGSFKPFYGSFSDKETSFLNYLAENKFGLVDTTKLRLAESSVNDEKLYKKLSEYADTGMTFYDMSEWRSKISSCDFAMGMNFHCNIAALQEGIPSLFVNYESSGRELCRFFGFPSIDISEFDESRTIEEYLEMVDYTDFGKKLEKRRKEYLSFLSENGIEVDDFDMTVIVK